ncbi:hypothetical protein ACOTVS_11220 [Aliarcobacter butzleri]|uniref:hypothetical protein n=1 Tax=Aliarcobacter butzleri TaxID=28197 RepID=UPI00344D671D
MIKRLINYTLYILKVQKEEEYINDDNQILDLKLLSKLVNSNVNSYAISNNFKEIACFCTKKNKIIFLRMRKYLKATEDINIHQYAKKFNLIVA